MIAKILLVCLGTCALAAAAPGIYDAVGVGYAGYAPAAYAHAPLSPVVPHIAQPLIAKQVIAAEPIDPNPAYSFSYGVSDPHTGDHKDAAETLQNGVVHGSYSLVEPDGHLRKVTYTADKINGFNAVVERTGATGPAVVAAPVAKYAVAPAPIAVAHAPIAVGHGPVALASPVAKIGYPW